MSQLNFLKLCLLSILLFNSCCNTKSSKNANKISKKLTETIFNDIKSAFKAITNTTDTELREQIIPKMYNLTRNPTFQFKIPNAKSETGYIMIFMDRSEMMKPIFPNLTIDRNKVMKQEHQAVVRNAENMNPTEILSNDDLWSGLGLEGWSGDIAGSSEIFESRHKDKLSYYPTDKILMDFELDSGPSGTTSNDKDKVVIDKSKKPNEVVQFTMSPSNLSNAMDISDNIYIARANDPFGYSTKWEFRNITYNVSNIDDRQKRDVVELYSMIKCATGCEPLTYQSYGCFCGFLGNGIAVDSIDSCCKMHDKCYEQSNCISYLQYFVPYVWKCYRRKPLCAIDHGEWGGPTSCAALLCYCDLRLSLCLRKFLCPRRKAICSTSFGRKLQNLFL